MIRLELIDSENKRNFAKKFIENNHSYVPNYNSVGRRIDFIIYVNNNPCGVIGIGSATYPPCKDVLRYLNITKSEYRDIFNQIGNNWRFCLSCNEKNVGTQVLSKFRRLASVYWYKEFGDNLKYIVTFVGGGHDGAVYKADNWKQIGFTSGLPNHESVSMKWNNNDDIKCRFVKPTGEDRKIIFIHEVSYNEKEKRPVKKELW